MILPLAVILKRLAAPRWVFSFFFGFFEFLGITKILSALLRVHPLTESLAHYNLLEWGAAMLRPYQENSMPIARLAANLVLLPEHPFWGPAARPGRCLPCVAWFRSGRVRRFRSASASSWR